MTVHCTPNGHWKGRGWLARKTSKHTWIFGRHVLIGASMLGSALKITSFGWKTSLCPFSQMGQWNSVLFWVHKHPFTVSANSLTAFPRAPARAMHVRKVSMSLSASHCCFLNCEFQRARGWPPIALVRGCRNGTSCVKIFLLVELSQPRSSVVRASAQKAERCLVQFLAWAHPFRLNMVIHCTRNDHWKGCGQLARN